MLDTSMFLSGLATELQSYLDYKVAAGYQEKGCNPGSRLRRACHARICGNCCIQGAACICA